MKKFTTVVFMISLLSCFLTSSFADNENAVLKFQEAEVFYKDGRYKDAISAYEKILKEGTVSGAIYYNLGNSYYRNNELGKAIVNYERAKRIMPRDADLAANYHHVQSLVNKNP